MEITDAKIIGSMSRYTHNDSIISDHKGKVGASNLRFSNSSPNPYIELALSGGLGLYKVIAVLNGKIHEMATCDPNGIDFMPTT
ncbi:hypothetical protein I4U23_016787 [Adineta vaga]|nr:hypothetical protein I4U23_016787 [Adineta vaga]